MRYSHIKVFFKSIVKLTLVLSLVVIGYVLGRQHAFKIYNPIFIKTHAHYQSQLKYYRSLLKPYSDVDTQNYIDRKGDL